MESHDNRDFIFPGALPIACPCALLLPLCSAPALSTLGTNGYHTNLETRLHPPFSVRAPPCRAPTHLLTCLLFIHMFCLSHSVRVSSRSLSFWCAGLSSAAKVVQRVFSICLNAHCQKGIPTLISESQSQRALLARGGHQCLGALPTLVGGHRALP